MKRLFETARETRHGLRSYSDFRGVSELKTLLLLHHALERMHVLARKIHDERDLRLGDLVSEDTAFADAISDAHAS